VCSTITPGFLSQTAVTAKLAASHMTDAMQEWFLTSLVMQLKFLSLGFQTFLPIGRGTVGSAKPVKTVTDHTGYHRLHRAGSGI